MQRLTRWGNSCGIRLGIGVLEAAGLKIGDFVSVRCDDSGVVRIRPNRRQPLENDPVTAQKSNKPTVEW